MGPVALADILLHAPNKEEVVLKNTVTGDLLLRNMKNIYLKGRQKVFLNNVLKNVLNIFEFNFQLNFQFIEMTVDVFLIFLYSFCVFLLYKTYFY